LLGDFRKRCGSCGGPGCAMERGTPRRSYAAGRRRARFTSFQQTSPRRGCRACSLSQLAKVADRGTCHLRAARNSPLRCACTRGVRPGGGQRSHQTLYSSLRLHDARVKAVPGNNQAPNLAESFSASEVASPTSSSCTGDCKTIDEALTRGYSRVTGNSNIPDVFEFYWELPKLVHRYAPGEGT
jgi:hypothetical protein